jgi:hypothetical protein
MTNLVLQFGKHARWENCKLCPSVFGEDNCNVGSVHGALGCLQGIVLLLYHWAATRGSLYLLLLGTHGEEGEGPVQYALHWDWFKVRDHLFTSRARRSQRHSRQPSTESCELTTSVSLSTFVFSSFLFLLF